MIKQAFEASILCLQALKTKPSNLVQESNEKKKSRKCKYILFQKLGFLQWPYRNLILTTLFSRDTNLTAIPKIVLFTDTFRFTVQKQRVAWSRVVYIWAVFGKTFWGTWIPYFVLSCTFYSSWKERALIWFKLEMVIFSHLLLQPDKKV